MTTARRTQLDCPINDCLTICNELLFHIGMELREKRGASLSLVSYPPFEADMIPLPGEHADRASAFLRWLLRTHVCITRLGLEYELLKMNSQLFLEEVPENSPPEEVESAFSRRTHHTDPFRDTPSEASTSGRARLLHVSEHRRSWGRHICTPRNYDLP
ncbi:hypothetical protein MTO96_043913 [Rhipicephalus appendiculatus]